MNTNELRQMKHIAELTLIVANNEEWKQDDTTRTLAELALKAIPELQAAPMLLAVAEMVQKRLNEKPGGVVAFTGEEWTQIDNAIAAAKGEG